MNKETVIETLQNMQEIVERLEEISEAMGLAWCSEDNFSLNYINLDFPEKSSILLTWEILGCSRGCCAPESESAYILLPHLWDDAYLQNLREEKEKKEKLRAAREREDKIHAAQEKIRLAEQKVSQAQEKAREELERARRELEDLQESY